MYAGRVACCPLVSRVEYAPSAILWLKRDGTDSRADRQTDGHHTVTSYAFC